MNIRITITAIGMAVLFALAMAGDTERISEPSIKGVNITMASADSCDEQYPGDVDHSGSIDITDLTELVDFIVLGEPIPTPMTNADVNGDCCVDEDDATYLSEYITHSGPHPVECTCVDPPLCCPGQMPGDVDGDGDIDNFDLSALLEYVIYLHVPAGPLSHADVNGDCCIDQNDIDYLTAYLNQVGPAPVECTCMEPSLCCDGQFPGDVNDDGIINVEDLTDLVDYIVSGEPIPQSMVNSDVNGDCCVDENDITYLSAYVHQGGPSPVECTCLEPILCCPGQYPGDANGDGHINFADPQFLMQYLYWGGPAPDPSGNGDPNGDCCVDLADLAYLEDYINHGGQPPVDCTCLEAPLCCVGQYPGDVDNSGVINVQDLTDLVDFVNTGEPEPPVMANADVDGDCNVGLSDVHYLSEYIHSGGPAPVECTCIQPFVGCCIPPLRGNVDYDPYDNIDISDLVYLVDYMFTGGSEPPCFEEADVNGDGSIDISDLIRLMEYMFMYGIDPEECP